MDYDILIVEDSPTQAEALRSLLAKEGARVEVSTSAEAALERLRRAGDELPDLVLSDIVMPGISGYDLTKAIKMEPKWQNVPVVLLTSLADPLDIVRGLECGADNYVTKPYEPEYLIARLRHVLGGQRFQRGLRATLGINVHFLGTTFTISSDREQILDLFLSSIEDVVRTNAALEQSQQELAEAQRQLEAYAQQMAQRAYSSGERLRAVVESSPVAIIAVDLNQRVTVWNPAAERMYAYLAEEVMDQPLKTIPPDRRDELARILADAKNEEHTRVETQRVTRDGRIIDVLVTTAALRGVDGTLEGFVGTNEDITERKRTAEALAKSQAQLVQAQKMEAIGTLAGGIAHDFNNLLTVMRSYSAMLVEELPEGSDEHKHFASEILGAADRAAALTRQLLSFSRKQVLQPRVVRVDDVILDVQRLLDRLLPANITLELALHGKDATVRMDPGQLEQVLMNLVVNASHAMPQGGRVEVATSTIDIRKPRETATGELPPGRYVAMRVTDTGSGMDEDTLSHLFEPFFTTKPAGTGTGLGMSIVRGIVGDQRGGITVTTAPGRGTTFEIFLPASAQAAEVDRVSIADIAMGNEVILVVEDDDAVRAAVRMALERFGYTVLEATDGAQGLRVSSMLGGPPDLLLTDLMMPEVTGREMVEELERDGRIPKVLLMSGYADDEVMRRGLADARYAFIQKPFTRESLARKVREVLDAPASERHD